MITENGSCKRARRILRRLAASSEYNPILIDSCAFSFNLGKDVLDICRYELLPDINLRELRENRKYFSFLYDLIYDYEKFTTIPAVIREQENGLSGQLNNMYNMMQATYDIAKDAMMMNANSLNAENAGSLHRMSEIRRCASEVEKIINVLRARSLRYDNEHFLEVKRKVDLGAERALENRRIDKISEADVELVAAAFYETLNFEQVPLILSVDKHINTIGSFALSFYPSQKELLSEGIRTYEDIRRKPALVF